jgi:hypothetical protein
MEVEYGEIEVLDGAWYEDAPQPVLASASENARARAGAEVKAGR